jgi:hypothetical protein
MYLQFCTLSFLTQAATLIKRGGTFQKQSPNVSGVWEIKKNFLHGHLQLQTQKQNVRIPTNKSLLSSSFNIFFLCS